MSNYPKLSGYVSEIDQLLQDFDKNNQELSLSQKKEIEKYRERIYFSRDQTERPIMSQAFSEDF